MIEVKCLDVCGNWYTNALVENLHDAILVAKFYREQLGYSIKVVSADADLTKLVDTAEIVKVNKI